MTESHRTVLQQTKGLALEQIDILYQNASPRNSVAYRNQLIANDVRVAQVYHKDAHGETQSNEEKEKV
jgi:MFS transporter, SP family, sugar:H+ symporter